MTKRELHQLRYEFDMLYHVSFDDLKGDNRLKFLELIRFIDTKIRIMENYDEVIDNEENVG